MKRRAAFLSVVPSPYQRDLYKALSARTDLDLDVFYLEEESPDSPWPRKPLAPYERLIPGSWFPIGPARVHLNWPLPNFEGYDVVVFNSLMSLTAQFLMRFQVGDVPWMFWGERLRAYPPGFKGELHALPTAPLHRAAGIAAIGRRAEADYNRRFPEPLHFNIPYYCELEPFLNALRTAPPPEEDLTFLFCGQMIARKGVDLLLQAFSHLVGSGARARLLLAGREAELSALLEQVPGAARRRIDYLGFRAPEDLPAVFAQAHVFILPSRYDGWGVVVNQALGAGLAILCSDAVGAAYDLVEPGKNGILFQSGSLGSLIEKMSLFMKHPAIAPEWGVVSRSKAGDWHPRAGAQRWVEAIEYVLAGRR